MRFDDLKDGVSWTRLWDGHILCGECSGIRKATGNCPACNSKTYTAQKRSVRLEGAHEIEVTDAFMGAEARFEDWV
jgi:hypothetical protein